MTDTKKKRMSMLDSLAAAGTPPAPGSMMSSNRALRSARDAVDDRRVELQRHAVAQAVQRVRHFVNHGYGARLRVNRLTDGDEPSVAAFADAVDDSIGAAASATVIDDEPAEAAA